MALGTPTVKTVRDRDSRFKVSSVELTHQFIQIIQIAQESIGSPVLSVINLANLRN
jgi:hypothetical protein